MPALVADALILFGIVHDLRTRGRASGVRRRRLGFGRRAGTARAGGNASTRP
jgi:hypothetical protein